MTRIQEWFEWKKSVTSVGLIPEITNTIEERE